MAPTAKLYRMVTPDHICPFGLKSKALLKRRGFKVEDHHLESRAETDAFKAAHGVETTPQTFINDTRVGGYDDLRSYFGLSQEGRTEGETTYIPVLVVFVVAALMALAVSWATFESVLTLRAFEWFIAFSMSILAILKLRDLTNFSNMFLGYDLLAQKWVRYAYVYPFAEALAGILMIAGAFIWIGGPIAILIGTIGAISVFKAVYIDKRSLNCACVGGNSNVPLGFVSLTENLMMVGMGIWMLLK